MAKRTVSFVFLLCLSCSLNVRAMKPEEDTSVLTGGIKAKKPKENEYVLEVGKKGEERLELQDRLLKDHTMMHLNMAKFSKKEIVYDLGCGPGHGTVDLAKQAGQVYGVDVSEEQIALAKERVSRAGLKNVEFLQGDIRTLKDYPHEGNVDVVYMRCVLAHVNNPREVIEVVKRLLKPGGRILSTEPIIRTFWEPSQHWVFRAWRELGKKVEALLKTDYDIGERLPTLFEKKDFSVEKYSVFQQGIDVATMKKLFALDIKEGPTKAVKLGAITQEEVGSWEKTIGEWDDTDPSYFHLPRFASVVAKKL